MTIPQAVIDAHATLSDPTDGDRLFLAFDARAVNSGQQNPDDLTTLVAGFVQALVDGGYADSPADVHFAMANRDEAATPLGDGSVFDPAPEA